MESFNRKTEKQPQMRNRKLKMLATEIVEENLLHLFQKMMALLIGKIEETNSWSKKPVILQRETLLWIVHLNNWGTCLKILQRREKK